MSLQIKRYKADFHIENVEEGDFIIFHTGMMDREGYGIANIKAEAVNDKSRIIFFLDKMKPGGI